VENKLRLEIVTPHRLVFSDEVDEVVAPGSEGEFGVLPGHVPFLTTLKIGIIGYRRGNNWDYLFTNWGYAEVGPDKVVILAESAEKAEEIDAERALAAKKRAEQRLSRAEEVDFARAQASIERATIRIQLAEKKVPR